MAKQRRVVGWRWVWSAVFMLAMADRAPAATSEIVLYASDVTTMRGNWARVSTSGAAGGQAMSSADQGWSNLSAPHVSPLNYFEATFGADAGTAYHVWIRLRAAGNSKYNDAVWVQFSDALTTTGSPIYRIGSSSGLLVNLATDSTGSSLSNWGWEDGAYWLSQPASIKFATTGTHVVRVQTREDGAQIDQIVLSASRYLSSRPGAVGNDGTIVSKSSSTTLTTASAPATTSALATTSAPATSSGSGAQISVLSWNIRINEYTESHARTAMARAVAVSPRPHVIVIQEAWEVFYGVYLDELQRRTGQTWYGAFKGDCAPGGWNGSSCAGVRDEGIAIFSAFPITATGAIYLPYPDCWTSARAALRASINVDGTTVQVFNTHLQTGGCTDSKAARYNSMSLIKSWARNFPVPQILGGDFNADPDQITSSSGMSPDFVDTWSLAGSGSRYTFPVSSPSMKLDYLFTDSSLKARPLSSVVVTSTGTVSDHFPVRTTFQIP